MNVEAFDMTPAQRNFHNAICDTIRDYTKTLHPVEIIAILSHMSGRMMVMVPDARRPAALAAITKNVETGLEDGMRLVAEARRQRDFFGRNA